MFRLDLVNDNLTVSRVWFMWEELLRTDRCCPCRRCVVYGLGEAKRGGLFAVFAASAKGKGAYNSRESAGACCEFPVSAHVLYSTAWRSVCVSRQYEWMRARDIFQSCVVSLCVFFVVVGERVVLTVPRLNLLVMYANVRYLFERVEVCVARLETR